MIIKQYNIFGSIDEVEFIEDEYKTINTMKITLKESDLKTLKEVNGLWSYSINTKNGKVVGSEISNKEEALKHAENNILIILKSILKK